MLDLTPWTEHLLERLLVTLSAASVEAKHSSKFAETLEGLGYLRFSPDKCFERAFVACEDIGFASFYVDMICNALNRTSDNNNTERLTASQLLIIYDIDRLRHDLFDSLGKGASSDFLRKHIVPLFYIDKNQFVRLELIADNE